MWETQRVVKEIAKNQKASAQEAEAGHFLLGGRFGSFFYYFLVGGEGGVRGDRERGGVGFALFELFPRLCNFLRSCKAYHVDIRLHYITVFEFIYRLCN